MPDIEGYVNTGYANISAPGNAFYGTQTCTLNSLANNAQRSSAGTLAVKNYHPANSPAGHNMGPLDMGVFVTVKTGTVSGGSPLVNVYIAGSNDGGNTWTDGVAGIGTDSLVTLTSPLNLQRLFQIQTPVSATTYRSDVLSVGRAFGGVLPSAWCLVIENKTGGALDATAGGGISYQMSVGVFF